MLPMRPIPNIPIIRLSATHRLDSARDADRICVLEDGALVDHLDLFEPEAP